MDTYRKIRNILIVVLGLNWFVALLKVRFGYAIQSASMVSDGYHSFSDGASNIIGLIGVSIALRPKDANHPYGHKKYETFAALLIASMLFIIAFHICHDTFERLKNPVVVQAGFGSFLVMGITLCINSLVMFYEYRMGKKLNSDILVADSMHTRSDILTSLAVVGALIGVKRGCAFMDPIGSFVIALFIVYAGLSIVYASSKVLCDTAIINTQDIEAVVNTIEGVHQCHDIRTRGRIDDIHIDLHVLVRKDMVVEQADFLSDKIEKEIKAKIAGVADVIVHVEPYQIKDVNDKNRQE